MPRFHPQVPRHRVPWARERRVRCRLQDRVPKLVNRYARKMPVRALPTLEQPPGHPLLHDRRINPGSRQRDNIRRARVLWLVNLRRVRPFLRVPILFEN